MYFKDLTPWVLFAAAIACAPAPDAAARRRWLHAVDAAERPLDNSLAEFDAAPAREAAQGARETLETTPVPSFLAYARGEELVYLNHLVPGFQAFVAGPGGPDELSALVSIRRRGRAHRERGREAMGLHGN